MHLNARLLRLTLRHVGPAASTLQGRGLHVSAVVPARRNRRNSPSVAAPKQAVFQGSNIDENDDEEFAKWYGEMQRQYPNKARHENEDDELPYTMEQVDEEEEEGGDDEEHNDESKEFVDEGEELFRLSPKEFQKRMETFDQRHAHEADDGDKDDMPEIDRATQRISKTKLAKVLGEFNPNKAPTGKNAERMPGSRTKTKNMAPLEKKPKQPKAERESYRQESVGVAVFEFVQNLLYEDADVSGADIVPTIVEAIVSPDLRRIVLFWVPVRVNSENQTIGKKKLEAVKKRLMRQERWVRRNVTQHLNMKYSPVVQFKQQKEAKAEEARSLFDDEMKWLDKV